MYLASTILMIRPAAFGVNEETAASNFFQQRTAIRNARAVQQSAVSEFDNLVTLLQNQDINVWVIEDTPEPAKPSAVFPNNWICTLPEGIIAVFPMQAPSRRAEKRNDILELLARHFVVNDVQDWSEFEVEGKFLEGTGSMIMDHENKVIYACYSPRTDISLLEKFANVNGYRAMVFAATDKYGRPVYHTNVVMALGDGFAVLCEEAIEEEWERIAVAQLLENTAHEIIRINRNQMVAFAGNMLQVQNRQGKKLLLMSQTAFDSLSNEQINLLSRFSNLLPVPVPTIEQTEGGSVRCMIAEIFLAERG